MNNDPNSGFVTTDGFKKAVSTLSDTFLTSVKLFSYLEDEGEMKMSEAKVKSLFSISATTTKKLHRSSSQEWLSH